MQASLYHSAWPPSRITAYISRFMVFHLPPTSSLRYDSPILRPLKASCRMDCRPFTSRRIPTHTPIIVSAVKAISHEFAQTAPEPRREQESGTTLKLTESVSPYSPADWKFVAYCAAVFFVLCYKYVATPDKRHASLCYKFL